MLPAFPAFGPIPLDAGETFDRLTSGLSPISDFTHAGAWAWAISQRIRVAELNGNLVLRYHAPGAVEPSYTFAGTARVAETAETLLSRLRDEGGSEVLRLVPEETARLISDTRFAIEENRDDFDYVYDLLSLVSCTGSTYSAHRRSVRRFWEAADACVTELNLADASTICAIEKLCARWLIEKRARQPEQLSEIWAWDDTRPLLRLVDCANQFPLLALGMYAGPELIALSVTELCRPPWAVCHFMKADTQRFRGIFAVLMQETAKALLARGFERLNFCEDMGLAGIRQAKNGFRPVGFVKKCTVRIKTSPAQ